MLKESLEKIRVIAQGLPEDDPDKVEMMNIEAGYSDLMEWALKKLNESKAQAEAAKYLKDLYAKRQKSFEGKADNMKDIAGYILRSAGERKFVGAGGTVSIAAKPQGVVVLDESLIPERFFKITKTLNKSELNKAVKDGEVIEGVSLDNGGETITIRS